MSAAARAATAAEVPEAPAPARRRGGLKKLLLILLAALLLLAAAGAAAVFMLWRAPSMDDELAGTAPVIAPIKPGPPPVYLPLDNFVVNLADTRTERFAQVGITLQMEDAKAAEMLKGYMPAVRNQILMLLAHKTSQELMTREGKEDLARAVGRAAALAMGLKVAEGPAPQPGEIRASDNPVRAVHFSSFIIQ